MESESKREKNKNKPDLFKIENKTFEKMKMVEGSNSLKKIVFLMFNSEKGKWRERRCGRKSAWCSTRWWCPIHTESHTS